MSEDIEKLPKNIKDRIDGRKYIYKDEVRVWNKDKGLLYCKHNIKICRICHPLKSIDGILKLPLIKNRIIGQKYSWRNIIRIWNGTDLKDLDIEEENIIKEEENIIENLPRKKHNRIVGKKYMIGKRIVIYDGDNLVYQTKEEENDIINILKDKYQKLPKIKDRIVGQKYIHKNKLRIWNGKKLLCEHGKGKSICKECGDGNDMCKHARRKYRCLECDGSGICEHKKQKSRCIDCLGSSLCSHGKRKDQCRKCGSSTFCIHDHIKAFCKDCGGKCLCSHGKRKDRCVECGNGSSLCEHKKRKYDCVECGGKGVCLHGKIKGNCHLCCSKNFCKSCEIVDIQVSKYKPYCFSCYCFLNPDEKIPRRYKMKEHYFYEYLKDIYSTDESLDFIYNKKIDNGCTRRLPDFFFERFTHSVIIEFDENQHQDYSCEQKRSMELFNDLGNRPLVMIRFNPDKYKENNIKHPTIFTYDIKNKLIVNQDEWDIRIKVFKKVLDHHLNNIPDKEFTEIKLFYTET